MEGVVALPQALPGDLVGDGNVVLGWNDDRALENGNESSEPR